MMRRRTLRKKEISNGKHSSKRKKKKKQISPHIFVFSKLHHPNIVNLIGHCEKDGNLCLLVPFKKGGDLS